AFTGIEYADAPGGAGADVDEPATTTEAGGDPVDRLGDLLGALRDGDRHALVFGVHPPYELHGAQQIEVTAFGRRCLGVETGEDVEQLRQPSAVAGGPVGQGLIGHGGRTFRGACRYD